MKHFILLSILFVILCMTSCQNTKVDDTLTELFEACWNCNESDVFKYIKAEQDDFTITQLGDTQNSVIHYESKQPLISIDNHMATLILEFNNEKLVLCGTQLFFPSENDESAYNLLYNCTAQYDKNYDKDPQLVSENLFRGEKNYNVFQEESKLSSNIQEEWVCDNSARLHLTYGKSGSSIRVLVFFMSDKS